MFFKFNLLQIYWFNAKWISIGLLETGENWGSLLHIGQTYDNGWEIDFLYFKMLLRWVGRRMVP